MEPGRRSHRINHQTRNAYLVSQPVVRVLLFGAPVKKIYSEASHLLVPFLGPSRCRRPGYVETTAHLYSKMGGLMSAKTREDALAEYQHVISIDCPECGRKAGRLCDRKDVWVCFGRFQAYDPSTYKLEWWPL